LMVMAIPGLAGEARAQAYASPALARLEGATVVVRQFILSSVPIPGTERPGTPMTSPAGFRLVFQVGDGQGYGPAESLPAKGFIGLQVHPRGPTTVEFRRIEVMRLNPGD